MAEVCALACIWFSAITRRRDGLLAASVAALSLEGLALVAGGADCPLGPFQRRLGDPVPLFEPVLPPRAAKAAVPALFLATVAGMLAVLVRPPNRRPNA